MMKIKNMKMKKKRLITTRTNGDCAKMINQKEKKIQKAMLAKMPQLELDINNFHINGGQLSEL